MTDYKFLSPKISKSYELIDSGGFEKLERFGDYILARPEPQAIWDKSLSEDIWQKKTSAIFKKTKGKNELSPEERGEWQNIKKMPEKWFIPITDYNKKLSIKLSLSAFKHVGIFPEQASNWQFIEEKLKKMQNFGQKPKVLNLFAYTGIASLVAKANGADITHVDSVKQVVSWSRENMEASDLTDIRWIVEDAMKFVKREVRRGNKYNGIILDPPAYGRGAEGEKWILEEGLNELVKNCIQLLDTKNNFFILNLYSMGFSALIAENLVKQNLENIPNPEMGELFLEDNFKKRLPLGIFYRFGS